MSYDTRALGRTDPFRQTLDITFEEMDALHAFYNTCIVNWNAYQMARAKDAANLSEVYLLTSDEHSDCSYMFERRAVLEEASYDRLPFQNAVRLALSRVELGALVDYHERLEERHRERRYIFSNLATMSHPRPLEEYGSVQIPASEEDADEA